MRLRKLKDREVIWVLKLDQEKLLSHSEDKMWREGRQPSLEVFSGGYGSLHSKRENLPYQGLTGWISLKTHRLWATKSLQLALRGPTFLFFFPRKYKDFRRQEKHKHIRCDQINWHFVKEWNLPYHVYGFRDKLYRNRKSQ